MSVTIGGGSAQMVERIPTPQRLIDDVGVDYFVLEMMSEGTSRSYAIKRQLDGESPPDRPGWAPTLMERLEQYLPSAAEQGTTIITNGGSAYAVEAADEVADIADDLGLSVSVTAVTGDECLDELQEQEDDADGLLGACAYTGAAEILPALEEADDDADCHVIIGGRFADPSMYLAPMIHEFGWSLDDWDKLGQGIVLGHLCECTTMVSGGFFMEPERKPVPDPHLLGNPYVEVEESGRGVISKPPGTGGRIDKRTAREQLLYEIHDPSAYLTPDVSADFTTVEFTELGENELEVTGGTGSPYPDTLRVLGLHHGGFRIETYAPYAGPNAVSRAQLTSRNFRKRLVDVHGLSSDELDMKIDLIGRDACFGAVDDEDKPWDEIDDVTLEEHYNPSDDEVQLRIAVEADDQEILETVQQEARSHGIGGPAAAGSMIIHLTPDPVPIFAVEPYALPRGLFEKKREYTTYTTGAPEVTN